MINPLLVAAILLLCHNAVSAQSPCEKVEYAKLKDSSRAELNVEYCRAMQRSKLNEDLRKISNDTFEKQLAIGANTTKTQKDMAAFGDAQITCLSAAEEATSMLSKKFKAKPPVCKN